jgi:hypothetical protein
VTVTVQVKTPLAPCPQLLPDMPTIGGMPLGGILDPALAMVYDQFAFSLGNGTAYWVETNYWDLTQPLTQVINLDCKDVPVQYIVAVGAANVNGVIDGSTFQFGLTYPVLRARVIQVFTHKGKAAARSGPMT